MEHRHQYTAPMNRLAFLLFLFALIAGCKDEVPHSDFIGEFEGTIYRDNPYTQIYTSEYDYTLELTTDTLENFSISIRRKNSNSATLLVEFPNLNRDPFEALESMDTLRFEWNNSDDFRNDLHRGQLWLSTDSIYLDYYHNFTDSYNVPFGALPEERTYYGAVPR